MDSPSLPDFSLAGSVKAKKHDLDDMSQEDLLTLRDKIDEKLTGIHLNDVNLVQEALIQFKKAKILQNKANKPNAGAPLNQIAQVQNSLANILKDLARLQAKLFDSEQRKRLQQATIKAVRQMPTEFQEKFFELYEPILEEAEKKMKAFSEEEFAVSDDDDDEDDGEKGVGMPE